MLLIDSVLYVLAFEVQVISSYLTPYGQPAKQANPWIVDEWIMCILSAILQPAEYPEIVTEFGSAAKVVTKAGTLEVVC